MSREEHLTCRLLRITDGQEVETGRAGSPVRQAILAPSHRPHHGCHEGIEEEGIGIART